MSQYTRYKDSSGSRSIGDTQTHTNPSGLKCRDRVVDGYYYKDKELAVGGFSAAEGVGWENVFSSNLEDARLSAAYWAQDRGYTTTEIQTLITAGYIPVASPADLNAVRTVYSGASKREFAAGTAWATGQINTLGTADKYVQVTDIDLYASTRSGGAYWNAGKGWSPIGLSFTGTYDGGGFIINGMYINSTAQFAGLFRYIKDGAILRNMAVIGADITNTATMTGVLVGAFYNATQNLIEDCIVQGVIRSSSYFVGGIVGCRSAATGAYCKIQRCVSAVDIVSTYAGERYIGNIAGAISTTSSQLSETLSLGYINGVVEGQTEAYTKSLAYLGYNENEVLSERNIYSYESTNQQSGTFATDESLESSGSRTLLELLGGNASNCYYDFAGNWSYKPKRFACPAIFGGMVATATPAYNLTSKVIGSAIRLTWEKVADEPDGYNLYVVKSDVLTKVNAALITALTYDYTPTSAGNYAFFVKAVYTKYGFTHETANSNVVEEAFYLPNHAVIDGGNVVIADGNDLTDTDFYTTIGAAVAREYGGVEAEITLTSSDYTAQGTLTDGFYGAGTIIDRVYEDATRKIEQTITVYATYTKIESNVTYKAAVEIDYEGFAFTGNTAFSKKRNVIGSGSGQAIIDNTGIWFHNGNYTMFKVLAGIDEDVLYKNYAISDTEDTVLYLTNGDTLPAARIMLQPDGYKSSFTYSNHADSANLARQKTVHFGSSDLSVAGTKGITSLGIKGDWSVFAKPSAGSECFVGNADYIAFLNILKAAGIEIIPHSIGPLGGDRADFGTYLPEFKNAFAPSNFIDHSLAGGAVNGGIHSKGWDSTDAANYIMDHFEDNGFDKAWAYGEVEGYNKGRVLPTMWGFEHNIAYFNDYLVMPSGEKVLLWKSSNRPFYDGWGNVDATIDDDNNIDAHDYLAAFTREASSDVTNSGKYTHYLDGAVYRITTNLNRMLAKIKTRKESGHLWNPSGTEFYEYFKQLKNVRMDIVDANTITVVNNNATTWNGL